MAKELRLFWNSEDRKILFCRGRKVLRTVYVSDAEQWRRASRYIVIITGANPRVCDFKRGIERAIEKTDKKWGRFAA